MKFEEYYFMEDKDVKEGLLSAFLKPRRDKQPANPSLWQTLMQRAKKQFGKRDSDTKFNWVYREYMKQGGKFA